MEKQSVIDALRQAMAGSRKVEITFSDKNEDPFDVAYLLGLERAGAVGMDDKTVMKYIAVMSVGKFERDGDRICVVTLKDGFNADSLGVRLVKAIEKIRVLDE